MVNIQHFHWIYKCSSVVAVASLQFIILLYCQILTIALFCGEGNTKKLEKIQERALRFIYNDSDSFYENLLEKSVTFTEIKEITFHGYRSF